MYTELLLEVIAVVVEGPVEWKRGCSEKIRPIFLKTDRQI